MPRLSTSLRLRNKRLTRVVHKTLSHMTETRPRRSIFSNSQGRDEIETLNLQDRDETETFNLQDRDETRRSKKVSRPPRDRDARPRRSIKRIETAVSQFKNTNWWSLSLDNVFLAGQIRHFFVIYSHCMHVHKTKVTRPRPRRYIFKTETRPRHSTFKTEARRDVPKKRLETASRPRRSRPRLHPWCLQVEHRQNNVAMPLQGVRHERRVW